MKARKRIFLLLFFIVVILAFLFWKNWQHSKPLSGQAILSWQVGKDGPVKGYKIYYGKKTREGDCPPGGYEKSIDVKNTTKYVIRNLESGATYYFSVVSYNDTQKESCFSQEMKKAVSISWLDKLRNYW